MKDPAIIAFSAGILTRNLGLFRKEYSGVLHSRDIEHVHRMRVAARRLSTALSIFESFYSAKRIKAWQKDVRQVTRILGRARDLDIQILYLRSFLRQVTEAGLRPGIQRLLLRTRQARSRVQTRLIKVLTELDQRQTILSMEMQAQLAWEKAKAKPGVEGTGIQFFASKSILPAIEDLLTFDPFVDQVEAVSELHAMRLAAKRLRYTLECFLPISPGGFEEEVLVLRKTQDLLGIIHDHDVWDMNRERFVERERIRTVKFFGSDRGMKRILPGLEYFYESNMQQRALSYSEFTEYWGGLRKSGFWDGMKKRLSLTNEHADKDPDKRKDMKTGNKP